MLWKFLHASALSLHAIVHGSLRLPSSTLGRLAGCALCHGGVAALFVDTTSRQCWLADVGRRKTTEHAQHSQNRCIALATNVCGPPCGLINASSVPIMEALAVWETSDARWRSNLPSGLRVQRRQLTRFDEHGQRRHDTAVVSVDGIGARDLNPSFLLGEVLCTCFLVWRMCSNSFGHFVFVFGKLFRFFVQAEVSEIGICAHTLEVLM